MTKNTTGLINLLGTKLILPAPLHLNGEHDLKPFVAALHGVPKEQIKGATIKTPLNRPPDKRICEKDISGKKETFHYLLGDEQKSLQIRWEHISPADDFAFTNKNEPFDFFTLRNNETRMFSIGNKCRYTFVSKTNEPVKILKKDSPDLDLSKTLAEHLSDNKQIQNIIFYLSTGTVALEFYEKNKQTCVSILGHGLLFMQSYSTIGYFNWYQPIA